MTFKGFGCVVGDTLYVASLERNKVCEFKVDCLKLFTDDITAHGYIYGLYGKWGNPTEFSVKKLNKRVIFTNKKLAHEWLDRQLNKEKEIK